MEIALIQKIQVTIPDQDNHNPPQDVYQNFFKKLFSLKLRNSGTSLVVQWLRLHASTAGSAGSIPGQKTRTRHPTMWPKK